MLSFLRKIRKGFLSDGRVSKYLVYAIGEIFLVVIGILIALQVNNWNTQRTELNELNEYLSTIAQNIRGDLPEIQRLKEQRDSIRAWSRRGAGLIGKDFYEFEASGFLGRTIISSFEVPAFNCNQSGFESLKNSGLIGKINGTALADSIFEYYRKVGIINNLIQHANTYSQSMQIELMKQQFSVDWGRLNYEIFRIQNEEGEINDEFWRNSQITLKKLYRHPSVHALFARNGSNTALQEQYGQIQTLGTGIIRDIENTIKSN